MPTTENIYYRMTVPVFTLSLTNLRALLNKAKEFIAEGVVTEAALLEARLAPDMFTFVQQVRIASDNAKGSVGRLAGVEIPKMEDNETSLDQLIDRIDRTIKFLSTVTPEQFGDASNRIIKLPWMPADVHFSADEYFEKFVLANFYFHYVTAYDILRHLGMKIGKQDFIGQIEMKND